MEIFIDTEAQPDDFITAKPLKLNMTLDCCLCPTLRPDQPVNTVERKNKPGHFYTVCEECKTIKRNERAQKYLAKRRI